MAGVLEMKEGEVVVTAAGVALSAWCLSSGVLDRVGLCCCVLLCFGEENENARHTCQ